jgi:hypothetical protein
MRSTVGQGRQVFAISLDLPVTKENRKFSHRTLLGLALFPA